MTHRYFYDPESEIARYLRDRRAARERGRYRPPVRRDPTLGDWWSGAKSEARAFGGFLIRSSEVVAALVLLVALLAKASSGN